MERKLKPGPLQYPTPTFDSVQYPQFSTTKLEAVMERHLNPGPLQYPIPTFGVITVPTKVYEYVGGSNGTAVTSGAITVRNTHIRGQYSTQ